MSSASHEVASWLRWIPTGPYQGFAGVELRAGRSDAEEMMPKRLRSHTAGSSGCIGFARHRSSRRGYSSMAIVCDRLQQRALNLSSFGRVKLMGLNGRSMPAVSLTRSL